MRRLNNYSRVPLNHGDAHIGMRIAQPIGHERSNDASANHEYVGLSRDGFDLFQIL